MKDKASWRDKLLVDARLAESDVPFFSKTDECSSFIVFRPDTKAADLPECKMILELREEDRAYSWRWWINSIADPSAGGCVPGEGLVQQSNGHWIASDRPRTP